jgi:hypothetical protein
MIKYLHTATLIFLASCGLTTNNSDKNEVANSDPVSKKTENTSVRSFKLTDKTVKFLWRADKYDEALKDTFNSIFIDENFCKTITDPERAVLGYVATFIGNECDWDGDYKEGRSNLKCKILTALNLGYQCSGMHLGFLRQMFKNDTKVLEELKLNNCPTTPRGATSQETFDEIALTVKGNEILVFFKASGINIKEGESWSWAEADHFQLDNDNIKLIKKDKSKVKRKHIDTLE